MVGPAADGPDDRQRRVVDGLVLANIAIWVIATIALVFIVQDYSGARGLFPILFGGIGVGLGLLAAERGTRS